MARQPKTARKSATRTAEQRQTARAATVKRIIAARAVAKSEPYIPEQRTLSGGKTYTVLVRQHAFCDGDEK